MNNVYSVCLKAIQKWGEETQLMVAVEEMAELTKEISKHYRGENNLDAISEEMADVYIMLAQMEIMLGNERNVKHWFDYKLNRLKERVEDADR